MEHVSKTYIIAKGQISGTYADGFHHVSEDGKIGYKMDREPTPEERAQMVSDIHRHREILVAEMTNLATVERILKRS